MSKVVWVNKDKIKEEMESAGWSASVSYDSKADHEKIAKHCISCNHDTPTRSMRFNFEISECSRSFSHEFVRHEVGVGKVQRSQRYVNEDGFKYVTPKGIMKIRCLVTIPIYDIDGVFQRNVDTWLDFDNFQNIVAQMYNGYIAQGCTAEDARYALTNATFTKIHVSFDWEGLKQFCYRRLCNRAQWEIREVAMEIKRQVTEVYPFLGEMLGAHCDIHGYCPELPKGCGKAPSKDRLLDLMKKGTQYELDEYYRTYKEIN